MWRALAAYEIVNTMSEYIRPTKYEREKIQLYIVGDKQHPLSSIRIGIALLHIFMTLGTKFKLRGGELLSSHLHPFFTIEFR